MGGAPVKLTFTREDDLQHSFFHTVSVERLEAGLDANGKPVAWLHRTVAPTIAAIFAPGANHEMPFELAMGAVDKPFAIPNFRVENPEAAAHARIGWFRSVSNIPHAFAIQSFVAELASGRARSQGLSAGADRAGAPDRCRRRSATPGSTARIRSAIRSTPAGCGAWSRRRRGGSGWGRKLPKGSGLGIAAHRSFVSYAAVVTEVRGRAPRASSSIPRVDIAFDCGAVVNPDRVRSQMEGAVVMGIGLATPAEISFKNGRVAADTTSTAMRSRGSIRSPREIRVHVLPAEDYDQPLGGVGEPGVPPVAPALANAIFAATGQAHQKPADPQSACVMTCADGCRLRGRVRSRAKGLDSRRSPAP